MQIAQEVVELAQKKVHTEWARKRIEFNAPPFCNRLQLNYDEKSAVVSEIFSAANSADFTASGDAAYSYCVS